MTTDNLRKKRCLSNGMSDVEDQINLNKKKPRCGSHDTLESSSSSRSSTKILKSKKKTSRYRKESKEKKTQNEYRKEEKPQPNKEKKYYTPKQSSEEGHFHVVCGEDITEKYKILDLMGQGTFAKVVEAWNRKDCKRLAIKIVRATKKYTRDAQFEIDILRQIKEDDPDDRYCTVKIQDTLLYHDQRTKQKHLCICFPKLGPSLLDFINKNSTFTLRGIAKMTKNICEALDFLHTKMHLIHTDLKPENILLSEQGYTHEGKKRVPRKYDVRIIDFGGATDKDHSDYSVVSTRHYRAPEVIIEAGWLYPADIWSLGCILIELYTGEVLFDTHDNREHLALMEKILGPFPQSYPRRVISTSSSKYNKYFDDNGFLYWPDGPSDKSVSKIKYTKPLEMLSPDSDFIDLLHKMLDYDKNRRITAREILSHQFITKNTRSHSPRHGHLTPRRKAHSRGSSSGKRRSQSS